MNSKLDIKILWFENDTFMRRTTIQKILSFHPNTKVVSTISTASTEIESGNYNVLLLDVMIPVLDEDIEIFESKFIDISKESNVGSSYTGYYFFRYYKKFIIDNNINVIIVTQRSDDKIYGMFTDMGISRSNILCYIDNNIANKILGILNYDKP